VADAAGLIELSLTRTEARALIAVAVREQTEWLMELVCPCGTPMREHDDDSDPICKLGKPITRAEYLRQRGEKP